MLKFFVVSVSRLLSGSSFGALFVGGILIVFVAFVMRAVSFLRNFVFAHH